MARGEWESPRGTQWRRRVPPRSPSARKPGAVTGGAPTVQGQGRGTVGVSVAEKPPPWRGSAAGAITLQVRSVLFISSAGNKQGGPQNRPGVAPPASRLASPSPAFLQRNTENGCQVSSASGPLLLIMLTPRPQGVRPGVEGPVRVGASCAFPFSTPYPPLSEVRADEVETGGAGRVPAKGLFSPANKDCLLINGERCGRSSPGWAEANEKALFTRPEP